MPYVRTRLGRWFYEERGASKPPGAPAIVLWHSLLFDGGMWREQIEPLSALGRVVVFDGPGHGKSEVPPVFTLEDNVEALVDALDELGVDQSVYVGLSWGGMLGMRFALRHPKRLRALALLDTNAEAESRANQIKYRLFSSFGRRLGLPQLLANAQIAPLFFTEKTRATRPELVERFLRAAGGFPRDGIYRTTRAVVVKRTDVLPRLHEIRTPTLVLCGREDRATPTVHSERIAQAIPGAKVVWIENAGHIAPLEQPKAVNDALVPFVAANLS